MATKAKQRSRDELFEAFRAVLNVCKPEHPYLSDPYPVESDEIEKGHCKTTGSYMAKCGPRRGYGRTGNKVYFGPDRKTLGSMSNERLLSVLVHEVTHVHEGFHTDGGGHNPKFWREFAFYATEVRDEIEQIEDVVGSVDTQKFLRECTEDPNPAIVDGRSETAEERKEKLRDLLL